MDNDWMDSNIGEDANLELIQRVREHIEEEPRRLDMHTWAEKISKANLKANPGLAGDCRTIGCIAGWARILEKPHVRFTDNFYDTVVEKAQKSLNITTKKLFFVGDWPHGIREKYYMSNKSKVVCGFLKQIERYLKNAKRKKGLSRV